MRLQFLVLRGSVQLCSEVLLGQRLLELLACLPQEVIVTGGRAHRRVLGQDYHSWI